MLELRIVFVILHIYFQGQHLTILKFTKFVILF